MRQASTKSPSSGAATGQGRSVTPTRSGFYEEPPRRGLRPAVLGAGYVQLPASTKSPLVGGCDHAQQQHDERLQQPASTKSPLVGGCDSRLPRHAARPPTGFYEEPPRRGLRRAYPQSATRPVWASTKSPLVGAATRHGAPDESRAGSCCFYEETPRRGLRPATLRIYEQECVAASTKSPLVGGCDLGGLRRR